MSEELKLLGTWGSPFSRRVELALRLKGVAYDYIEEDNLYSNKSALLLESNPVYKKIPVLFHGGKPPIAESVVILEYIDETWTGGHRLLPPDPLEKAKARFLTKFIDDKCLHAVSMSFQSEGEAQRKFMEEAEEYLSILEGELKGKKFFGGESIGMVDIVANFLTIWVDTLQEMFEIRVISEEKHPILWTWSREFLKSDAVKECTPDREQMIALFKARRDAKARGDAKYNSCDKSKQGVKFILLLKNLVVIIFLK